MKTYKELIEKTLTPAELKKREEIAKAMERETPGMDMGKKMAIATAAAKRVAEDLEEQAAEAPSLQKHRIGVRVTNPNNKREVKYVIVTHSSDKKGAAKVGEKHFKKKGYAVHGSFHSGMVSEEVELDEAASVSVTVQALAPADKKYAVTEIHPRTSPRGRTKWKDISYHGSEEEAKAAADAHAKKNNLHRMKSSVAEEVEIDEADWGSYSKRQFKSREMEHELGHEVEPKRSAPATSEPHAVHINGKKWKTFQTKSHATNVANKIKGATVVKESTEELNTKQKNEGTEMLSFKYYQVALEEAKKARKESEIENAHTSDDEDEDELEGNELDEVSWQTAQAASNKSAAKVAASKSPEEREKNLSQMKRLHKGAMDRINATPNTKKGPSGYQRSTAGRLGEEAEDLDEVSWQTAQAASNKSASKVAASKSPEEREKNLAQMKRLHKGAMERINATPNTKKGPSGYQRSTAGRLGEETEDLDEASVSHAAKTTMKHVKNPTKGEKEAAKYIKPGIAGYGDRAAMLKSAEARGGVKEEVEELDEVSPFDWKAYAKEKAKSATTSGTTKTYHDVKKTSTGTVYTKQSTPDGLSKGSGEDAAKAEEPPVKRGRGRPAGVGAKAGGYKPRDPAKKAASAAKAAASKAANRAMRKESFDEEFMGSLIEGFEEEDFEDFLQCEEFDDLDESTREALLNFINEKSCGSYKMKESLTGKQHKLDKNKNGKLDSHDFKLLRKEETEQIQESVSQYAAFLTKKN